MISDIQIETIRTEIAGYSESYADYADGGVYHEHYGDAGEYYDWDSDRDP